MIDSMTCGNRFLCISADTYALECKWLREMIMNVDNSKYRVKSIKFKKNENSNAPTYVYNYKVFDIYHSDRYALFSFFKIGAYKNSYDFKFHSELSHFSDFFDFNNFIYGIGKFQSKWINIIESSICSNIHLKIDLIIPFDFFRIHLSYPYCKDPKIMVNSETGKRTLYLTKNFYIYEKVESVRIERRFVRSRDIQDQLMIRKYKDLIYHSNLIQSPFIHLTFYNPNKLLKKITGKAKESYLHFLQRLNSTKARTINTKKGLVLS